jgi:hypothetical protein
MDVLTLRTELETLLVDLLGEYTLGNGMKTPAVSVRSPGEALPAKTTVSGLELVILREPELDALPAYTKAEALRLWTLFLVDWQGGGGMTQAASRVVRDYPGTSVTEVRVPEGVGPQAQMRLRIRTGPDRVLGLGES